MVPRVGQTGRSFAGAGSYFLFDREARTTERVEFTHTVNLPTQCPHNGLKFMAWTAKHHRELKLAAGHPTRGEIRSPVFAFSISWAPDESPTQPQMIQAMDEAVAALGLEEHEAVYAAHNDRPHPHIHAIVNRVHPFNGKAHRLFQSKKRLSAWALEFERRQGEIRCKVREERANERALQQSGERWRFEPDECIVNAWEQSDNGQSFVTALDDAGYTLARGRRGKILVIDPNGEIKNPVRHLQGVKTREFRKRIKDLNMNDLGDAYSLQHAEEARQKRDWQSAVAMRVQRQFNSAVYELQELQRQLDAQAKAALERITGLRERHEKERQQEQQQVNRFFDIAAKVQRVSKLEDAIQQSSFWDSVRGRQAQTKNQLNHAKQELQDTQRKVEQTLTKSERRREQALDELNKKSYDERRIIESEFDRVLGLTDERGEGERGDDEQGRSGDGRGSQGGKDKPLLQLKPRHLSSQEAVAIALGEFDLQVEERRQRLEEKHQLVRACETEYLKDSFEASGMGNTADRTRKLIRKYDNFYDGQLTRFDHEMACRRDSLERELSQDPQKAIDSVERKTPEPTKTFEPGFEI